jgi:thiol-disulfide isomerase/thioredoxin
MVRVTSLAFVLLAVFFSLSAAAQEKTQEVKLRVVKYDGLKEEVLKNRGKVVLVDFWGTFCPPCIAAFPHTVKLHEQYQSKGLAVISVALDSLEDDPSKKEQCETFLKKKKATFTNLLLDEPLDFWVKKFQMKEGGPPCFYVFSRQGKWTQFHGETMDEKKMDQLIEQLLNEK